MRGKTWWQFGVFEYEAGSVALMTDGIYDVVASSILAGSDQPLYIAFVRPFLNNNLTHLKTEEDFLRMKERSLAFISNLPAAQVSDDKTIAVLMNTEVLPPVQAKEYYAIPDFKALHEERMRKLYMQPTSESKDEISSKGLDAEEEE